MDREKEKAVIGEIQFLLKFMLRAKSMGHSLYSVLRRREFIDDISKLMNENENRDDAQSHLKSKISVMAMKKDVCSL